jgi:hypothetical protein
MQFAVTSLSEDYSRQMASSTFKTILASHGIKHISNFVKKSISHIHTNIIIMSAPHRHDLEVPSHVNSEVKEYRKR